MFDIIIVGAGGLGREVYQWAKHSFPQDAFNIKGFLDDNPGELDNFDFDVGIVGDILNGRNPYKIKAKDRFLFAIGNVDLKKRIVVRFKEQEAIFLTLIHPTTVIANTAKIGEGVIICPFVTVSDNVVLDDFVMMNFYSSCGHDAKIGKYCTISPYATVNGFAVLEDKVFLGTHATVTAYRKVGYSSKISANSVAMYDVPAQTFVYGVPGKNKTIFTKGE